MSASLNSLIQKTGSKEKAHIAVRLQLQQYRKKYPSLFFVPNRGQWRFIKEYDKKDFPRIGAILAGNGVGKTKLLVEFLIGLIWGKKYLNSDWLGKIEFWDHVPKHTKNRRIRVVCKADDIDEGGSLYQEILDSFPEGIWKWKKKGSAIKGIRVDNDTMVSFRTFDQNIVAHAGSNEDAILFNEPPPEHLWGENVARIRNGGMIQLFMTPLKLAAWMHEQIVEDSDGLGKVVTEASIWDNCRDIPGTNGVLPRDAIETMIREWKLNDPDEADARINGTFGHLSGRVFTGFDHSIHVIDPFEIPRDWNIYLVCDPHDVRPPFVQIWAVDPLNNAYCIDEYPFGRDYTKMKTTRLTYDEITKAIKDRLGVKERQLRKSIMDPNKGKTTTRHNNKTVMQEYNDRGFRFMPCSNDDLDTGHKKIASMLYGSFNKELPISETNCPKMFFFRTCSNTINSISKYCYKEDAHKSGGSLTNKIDQKYKDGADCTRYFAVDVLPYRQYIRNGKNGYSQIDKARAYR